jgi:putative SOS response-associated peptidase YedK
MCGRFTLTTHEVDDLARTLAAEVDRERARLYRPRWNVAPTDEHWIVRLDTAGRRRLVSARFGFEGQGGQLLINARSETAANLPSFRRAFADGRCLVPADGFFEWRGGRADRRPLWFHDPGGKLLVFAGLATERAGSLAFVILTTTANDLVRPLHDRMPVLLSPEGAQRWLSCPDAELLAPAPAAWLVAREVSARVNVVANDGPELLEPPPPERQLKLI